MTKPRGFLLIGSLPLESTEEVYNMMPKALPGRLRCIPDGETGERQNFVRWQNMKFPPETRHSRFEHATEVPEGGFKLEEGHVQPTGYDEEAIKSYKIFEAYQEKGTIEKSTKFQVCIPTPSNVIWNNLKREFLKDALPLYEAKLVEALRNIQSQIPKHKLVIQIDCAAEFAFIEYEKGRIENEFFKSYYEPVFEGAVDVIDRISAAVDPEVELGYHLCYGDIRNAHFVQPEDAINLVLMANALTKRVGSRRSISWFHMPVPKDRTDLAYISPLGDLNIGDALLVLGLVHADDENGTLERIKAAQSVWSKPFAVSTECGQGRTPRERLERILEVARSVTDPW